MADSRLTDPFHDIPGVPNFRDIGGYPVAHKPGYTVRRGLIFRSSEPSNITDDGISRVTNLGITHIYDLRSALEIKNADGTGSGQPVRKWDGPERVFAPVFMDHDYSPEVLAARYRTASEGIAGFVSGYKEILVASTAVDNTFQPFRTVLRHLASSAATPILVHCTGGKDRTGVLCALILSLCGVGDDLVAYEYALTNLGLAARKEELLKHLTVHGGNLAAAERLFEAREENMIATLAMIRDTFGSVEQYVIEWCGLSLEEVDQVRKNLLVESKRWLSHERSLD